MQELYIPTLHSFAMGNSFTGSCGEFRFRITPIVEKASPKEVDFAKSSIRAEYWHGPFCYEKSKVEAEDLFAMSEEGRLSMKNWLEQNI